MRGEHHAWAAAPCLVKGSSPHARRAPMVRPPYLMTQGIISACAGSTSRRNCATCGSGDHPRMRGEHVSLPTDIVPLMGSSPHARGARGRRCRRMRPCRIIPACAGSTCLYAYTTSSHPDHPRMRGEHFHLSLPRPLFRGSSPHARGARAVAVERTTAAGIIPACAGSTLKDLEVACGWGDHPRMRGEHELPMQLAKSNGGSSPHARGALLADIPPRVRAGIIPACAGSTIDESALTALDRDHPRMRGEHLAAPAVYGFLWGSSPHARGAPGAVRATRLPRGIIPACAGSTGCACPPGRKSWDHPRMRGEHCSRRLS